jgi:endopolyphosphatase
MLTSDRYFFTSNSGVDGCANKHEPGFEHMEWLRIQLSILRDRGMKAILMGHVPPARVDNKESWDETCWQKYTLWVQQYRDVIVGSLYGHMNIDHFMLQDFDEIDDNTKKGDMARVKVARKTEGEIALLENGEVTVASVSDYLLGLREAWSQLPSPLVISKSLGRHEEDTSIWAWLISTVSGSNKGKKPGKSQKKKYLDKIGGKYAERYSVSHVSPSVVPNYFPTLRIIEYNITGLEDLHMHGTRDNSKSTTPPMREQLPLNGDAFLDDEGYEREMETRIKRKQKERNNKVKKSKYRFKVPEGPSKSAPPGPAYSPQTFTFTRFVQYFANLTHINNDYIDPSHHIPTAASLIPNSPTSANDLSPQTIFGLAVSATGEIEHKGWKEGKHKKHQGKQPKPEPHPNEFVYEVEYDTKDMKFPDLTVRRWVEYARKIGQPRTKTHSLDASKNEYMDDDDMIFEDSEAFDEAALDEEESDEDYDTNGKKHKKKKHKKHFKPSKQWYTFVKRAFVGTMDSHEIHSVFGGSSPPSVDAQTPEIVEL